MNSEKLTPTQALVLAQARIGELETQLNANTEQAETLRTAVAERDAALTALDAANERMLGLESKQTQIDAEVEAQASIRAQEILATTGVAPIPAATQQSNPQDVLEQFNAITDPAEKSAFYRAHRTEIRSRYATQR